jgi:hypothetical protein
MKKWIVSFGLILTIDGLLAFSGCKTADEGYDIRGTWTLNLGYFTFTITFSGSTASGTATDTYPDCTGNGTYTVNDTQVTFIMYYPCGPYNVTFTGTIANENYMSGTWIETTYNDTGTWTATR